MSKFRDYLKERVDDEMGKERHPVMLSGESGSISATDVEQVKKELKRMQSLMYNARDNGNESQYNKYKKDYKALYSKLHQFRKTEKQISNVKKDVDSSFLTFITTPGQSGGSEYK